MPKPVTKFRMLRFERTDLGVSVGEFYTIEKDKQGHSIREGNKVDLYARRDEGEI